MSGICLELDARLSAELDRYYFSTDGSGLNLDRWEKHRVINALHRLWNMEEIACYHPNASPLKIITEQLANKANILRNNRKSCDMNQHLFKKL